jgi:hypothetical protein
MPSERVTRPAFIYEKTHELHHSLDLMVQDYCFLIQHIEKEEVKSYEELD